MVSSLRSRPPTPARSPPPEDAPLGAIAEGTPNHPPAPPRRSSFGFLRRSKSGETLSRRSTSGSKIIKRQASTQKQKELQRRQEEAEATQMPPALPALESPPPIHAFSDDHGSSSPPRQENTVSRSAARANSRKSIYSAPPTSPPSIPIPPIPDHIKITQGDGVDDRARIDSMTHRGRYSYASSMISTVNNPRRVRRRKDPTPFK